MVALSKDKLSYFFAFSFSLHMIILFFLFLFSGGVIPTREIIPFMEVTLIKMPPTGAAFIEEKGRTSSPRKIRLESATSFMAAEKKRAEGFSRVYKEPGEEKRKGDIPFSPGEGISSPLGPYASISRAENFPPAFPQDKEGFLSGGEGEKWDIGGPISQRGVRYAEYPVYPEWAQKKGLEAKVKLKFWVSPQGGVEEVAVLQRGYLELDNLAIEALKKWRFEPLPEDSRQISQWGTITMIFKLR